MVFSEFLTDTVHASTQVIARKALATTMEVVEIDAKLTLR